MTASPVVHVVAVIPAKDRADSIAATVTAVRAIDGVDRVLVVDDGSRDATGDVARSAGAEVLVLPSNRGKGGAVAAAVAATPDADVYLLVDADVGATAAATSVLLDAVVRDEADMAVGVLPAAGGRGGFGVVRDLAARGIRRASGFVSRAPLSGQRAVKADLLRTLDLAPRFGLETAMTIDAVRQGARVVELPVAMDHRHTGRRLAGFRHRGRQGVDILRALWPRLTTARQRVALIVLVAVVGGAWAVWSGGRWEAATVPLAREPSKVVLFGMPHLGFDDLGSGDVPHLDRLRGRGAVAAMSVRTMSGRPSTTEGYATLNAGTRVRAGAPGSQAFPADFPVEGGTAAQVAERRTGTRPSGSIVVLGYPSVVRQIAGKHLSSEPGALGDALRSAGVRTAVVGNADNPGSETSNAGEYDRPIAMALLDRTASVATGVVDRSLLRPDPAAPYGVRFDHGRMVAAVEGALRDADVVAVDAGDLDRAAAYLPLALDRAAEQDRRLALRRTDALLGDVVARLPDDALLLVVSVSPPNRGWRLTPMVAVGPGIPHGYVNSPSVKRLGVVTVTDVAPTVLRAVGGQVPDGMIGHAFRYHATDRPELGYLRNLDRDADYRESIYFPITLVYIVVQAILYLFAMLVLSRHQGGTRISTFLKVAVVAVAAFPLASFVFRALPEVARLGDGGVAVLLAVDALLTALALRARRHALSPLSWIAWATVLVIVVDLATGARLQYSSLLGYSLHTAARFFGLGNTGFAVLAASAAIAACIHVAYAPRRNEAMVTAGALLAVTILADGAPSLGNDVGGILTLVPVYGLTMVALSGRVISWRTVALVVGAGVLLLGVATGVDLLRPEDDRTHLGRFVSDLVDGSGESGTTVARKAATNVRVLGASVWTWMVPIVAVFMLFVLVYLERGRELLPKGSALRVGVIAALSAGLLGFAVNDSGVVVTALVFVYLGPYLTLLALHGERGEVPA